MVGYNKTIQLINYVDALAVWGLRPHAPPLTMSVDLTGIKFYTGNCLTRLPRKARAGRVDYGSL